MTTKTKRQTTENKADPKVAMEAIEKAEALEQKAAPREELAVDRHRNASQEMLQGMLRDVRPITYEHESPLSLPVELEERMKGEGFELRWIRYSVDGKPDVDSIRKRRSEGYVFLTAGDVPEIADLYSGLDSTASENELILRNDVALAKIEIRTANAIRERKRARVSNDMEKIANAHTSRGVQNSSQAVAAKGTKRPGFGDNND